MPSTNEVILLQAQAGLEVTRGTSVAATRKVYAQITPSYTKALMDFADTSGTFEGRRRAAYAREKVAFTGVDILTYEDGPWWMQLGLKGGVAGAGDAGSPVAYTYAFTPTVATDDLKSMTLEFGESGNQYESAQVMVNQFTLRMDSDNDSEPGWMIDLQMMGLDWNTTTFTPALADRSTEVVLARGTKLYIDDAGGTIGTTQKTGTLISCSITVQNQIHYKAFAETVSTYTPNKVGRGQRLVDAQFTFEFDNDTEFAKYRNTAPQQRLIRLKQTGTNVHGGSSVDKTFQVDLYGYWSSWSRSDREGNLTCTFGLMGFYDVTATKTIMATFINALATLA